MDPIRLLSTKQLHSSITSKLLAKNIECVQHDFIEIHPLPFSPDLLNIGPDNWIITSQNSWSILSDKVDANLLKRKIIFCVGQKTKAAIEADGFHVALAAKNSKTLAKIIISEYSKQSFQYFSGDQRMTYLPNLFQKENIDWCENVIYATKLTTRKIDEPIDAIMFFSPSGISSYFESNIYHDEVCFCIGNTTAMSLENHTDKIIIAENHTIESVIESVIKHYT